MLRKELITINVFIKKEEISNQQPALQFKELEIKVESQPKISRRKEIIKIRAEINEIENRKIIEKTNKTRNWFIEQVNKINKTLAALD